MLDFGAILSDIAPDLISSGANLLSSQLATSGNDDAANDYNAGTAAAADRVRQGYEEQLGHVEEGANVLSDINRSQYADTTGALNTGYEGYADGTRDSYGKYAEFLYPQQEVYGDNMVASDQLYRTELNQAENVAGNVLGQAADTYAGYYDPYIQSGQGAQSYMTAAMNQNPAEMNLYQDMLVDDYRRDAIARLSSSGLRGAGRAGVAAVNEGEADLLARMYIENQNRSDNMAGTLNSQGYSASGNVAANEMGLGNSVADLRYQTAGATSGNTRATAQNVAGSYYDVGKDVADKMYTGETNIASANLQQGKDTANLTGQYYGNLGNIEAGRYGARGDTAMGVATNDATAEGITRDTNFAAETSNNNVTGTSLGQIASTISSGVKKSISDQNSANNQPNNPATMSA